MFVLGLYNHRLVKEYNDLCCAWACVDSKMDAAFAAVWNEVFFPMLMVLFTEPLAWVDYKSFYSRAFYFGEDFIPAPRLLNFHILLGDMRIREDLNFIVGYTDDDLRLLIVLLEFCRWLGAGV